MSNLEQKIQQACNQIAPLWPLSNFVAVNPYMGFSDKTFAQTALYLKQVQDADMLMPLSWYKHKFEEGKIGLSDLRAAVERAPDAVRSAFDEAGVELNEEALKDAVKIPEPTSDSLYCPGAFSAYLDAREGTHWQHFIREEAAKWCAAFYDRGQASWQMPWKTNGGFYESWRQAVEYDHNLSCAGLPGVRSALAKLPDSPQAAIEQALSMMSVNDSLVKEWLYRVLLSLPGWAGHLRYLDREKELRGGQGTELLQLLAILVSYERLLHHHFTQNEDCLLGWQRILTEEPLENSSDSLPLVLAQRLLWQSAFEQGIASRLRSSIQAGHGGTIHGEKPEIQAAFCIDVRSEVFRRNLETASPNIQTIGFAGFFGVPLRHLSTGKKTEQARCPALLAPPLASHDGCNHPHEHLHDPHAQERSWKGFREAAASCFNFVETIGLGYAWKLIASAFNYNKVNSSSEFLPGFTDEPSIESKVELAAGIIKGLTLTRQCGKLVLLCGHGSATQNNPYASGLDCGACGGHQGDANARIAAAMLNDPAVRPGLAENGLTLPHDVWFIAGLHNTTTDAVTLFDENQVPPSHAVELQALKEGLAKASIWTACSRANSLDGPNGKPVEKVHQRSLDWSQVRPEWGLAGNAGFIIAPRSWTKNVNLDGRAFLHEYDPSADLEGILLESIMAGPLVVGSWINLQYYASATDNPHYGSGHKAIHNVVGGLGVALGNESDLRTGLPLQSVHNGKKLMHEPSRLHACVAADPAVIDNILEKHPEVKELVENQWLHLFALGADGTRWMQRMPGGQWQANRMAVKLKASQGE